MATNYIVLRLTPANAIDPGIFASYLTNLTVKVYDISYASVSSGGVSLGSAVLNVNMFQHGVDSVATAVIPFTPSSEYAGPNLRVEFVRTAPPQQVSDPNIYYDAPYQTGTVPTTAAQFQALPPTQVSAYVTVPAPLSSTAAAALQIPTDGTPPKFGDLWNAVNAVLTKDPSPAPTPALIAALTLDQCRNIAYEIVYGPQPGLPVPSDSLEKMYTYPTNDNTPSNTNEQARQAFQGALSGYYAPLKATAESLANFVFSLAAALACEQLSILQPSAIVEFPVDPNGTGSLATVAEAEVVFTGVAKTIDVPAEYFYALTAQMPPQVAAPQRFAMAIGADEQHNLTQLTNLFNSGWLSSASPTGKFAPNSTMNPAQAVRALGAMDVSASPTVVQCDITKPVTASTTQIWTDWLVDAWVTTIVSSVPQWTIYQPGADVTKFWRNEASTSSGPFLDLVLWVLTQGWVDTATGKSLASEIKTNLVVAKTSSHAAIAPIHNVGDLALALPSDWQTFFAGTTLPNSLPPFTLPGSSAVRIAAFIRAFQSFFGTQSLATAPAKVTVTTPPGLGLPAFDVIGATITAYSGFAFGSVVLKTLVAAAKSVAANDARAQAWAVQAIWTLNELYILTKPLPPLPPPPPPVPLALRFSVMEALFARGFTSVEDVLDLPSEDFQQALTGTVAYDYAATIYVQAKTQGTAHTCTQPGPPVFTPINPGCLTDCVPPLYLSPLGPIAYLQEMLKVSECSTCDDPFPYPQEVVPGQNGQGQAAPAQDLGAAIAQRRGPIDTTLLATRANLETPIPLIDMVNECLEYAASAQPPFQHGTIYNTPGDALAGHALCVEECCEKEEDRAACHNPATLFAALPEYSTPWTQTVVIQTATGPVTEVQPAAYTILKSDFSTCCLPYSQALDVSRTYTEHFRTCRFELMRTFRKCITEYVLGPDSPPAGCRPYLWRYPVRIDIAIEYLGITPEEYTLLFGGVWPGACDAPCGTQGAASQPPTPPPLSNTTIAASATVPTTSQLYGFPTAKGRTFTTDETWTGTVLQLSEFLKRTCLTYCEFLDLWKSGFVKFGNGELAGEFPDCEPCCLEPLHLAFTEEQGIVPVVEGVAASTAIPLETSLHELAVFIRLWRKLKGLCGGGYSFQQLADICSVLPLFNAGTANPEFIRQLAAFQMLRHQLRLPLTDERATIPPGASGADRTFLLSLWPGAAHQWDWALGQFMEGIANHAMCRFECERREPEFLKQLAAHLDCFARLAGFDPATATAAWHAAPTHTLRFAELLAKVYASKFSIGEILFLFAADDCLCAHPESKGENEHEHEHEHKPSPWQLRRKLLEKHVPTEETEDWTWSRLESALQHEFGCGGAQPSLQRQQAMFDCWERIFDYDRARKERRERSEGHLRFFQAQSVPVYALTTADLEDDGWMVRCGHADRWMESLSRCFRVKDIAHPELWASDDPAALVAGETETGNAKLSRFLGDGCLETGAPRLYGDLEKLNNGLRERGRCALIAYLCGANGIVATPKQLSDLLLLDVETGLCEKASRVEEAITAVQTFVQRSRIGLEPGWRITPQFAHMWDSRFASYRVWQACKRRELYKENWIDWHELEKAKKIESFRFMDEELRRVTLTIAAPGGVDYWPEHRPPSPSLCLLQDRDPAAMQLLLAPREGLGLLATPERDGRPSWTAIGLPQSTAAGQGTVALPPSHCPLPPNLPFWMESAIKLGAKFVRVAAAGYPPASTPFEPWKSSHPTGTAAGTSEECCVECCVECGCRHPAHVDEYYFWLVDGRHFDPQDQGASSNSTFDAQQNAYYDPNLQESTPWHNLTDATTLELQSLLEWPSKPMVRLGWCRVNNGEFQQQRISDHGIVVSASAGYDISLEGRAGDSLYFLVPNAPGTSGFRYDLAEDMAHAEENLNFLGTSPVTGPLSGLMAYPYFVYFQPGARLFPWSPYSPAIAVANALRAHCRFEAALKWYDLYYDPLCQDNTWAKCLEQSRSQPSGETSGAGTIAAALPPLVPAPTPAIPGPPAAVLTTPEPVNVSPLVVSSNSVLFPTHQLLVTTPAPQSINVTTSGAPLGVSIAVAVSPAAGNSAWLIVTPPALTTPASATFSYNPAGLTPGTYVCNVTFSANNPAGASATKVVLVTLTVIAAPLLLANGLSASADPVTTTTGLAGTSAATATVSLTASTPPASVPLTTSLAPTTPPGIFTVTLNRNTTPATLTITGNATGLTPNTAYNGSVTVSSPETSNSIAIPLVLKTATTCCDSTAVSCHVARNRSVLLHYLETLVEWGDALMRRDSPEQFQQARVIFDSARRILGRQPHKLLNPAAVNPTGATVATFVPLPAPINPRLMMLYDRLDDRMALIHHCLDKRRLRQASERHDAQYWGNDPVRDGWRSDLCHCCEDGECHPHSPYRFTFLIQKAKELANQTRELGGALLAAFEKGDAEYLASVRAVHERELLALGRKVREGEWRDADFQVQALQKTKEVDQASRRYYANLIAAGLISNENSYVSQTSVALIERAASNVSEGIAQIITMIPDFWIGTTGVTTQPPAGTKASDVFKVIARIMTTLADIASTTASLDLTEAGWDRRLQDWIHQVQILDIQIEQVELQILGAERRRDDSLQQLNNQQTQIEQSTEVMNFLRDKFTNHAVYLFLQKNTADLHYQMYLLALSAAREAERAFHVERGHDTRKFVSCEGWDNLHEGLLAGERLQLSLVRMEKEYCDRNRREYELTKHISLRLQFPMEFLRLKLTGHCEIDLAEWRFDQDYPGHFMRRIKDVSLTIPSVSGPYNGVHCRLTLLKSATRVDPLLSLSPAHCCDKCKSGNGYEACPHDPRIERQYAATEAIATSSGQNDSGLFEMNIHDERYLPFEYHGAVSKWRIELPPENNYFDMDTLSDLILHLNYTSREGGDRLRHAARESAERRLPGAGWCLFDVQHDFPDAWELFRSKPEDQRPRHLNLKFTRNLFPFLPGHREVRIEKMALLFDTCEKPHCDCCAGDCACGEEKTRACWRVGFKNRRDECEEATIRCAASGDWSDLYHGVVDAPMGPLGRNGDRQEARFRFPAEVGEICQMFLLCRYEVAPRCPDGERRAGLAPRTSNAPG